MKIVVLMKPVPDTWGPRVLSLETGLADRAASETVLDEIGERALEAALRHAESASDVEVVVLTMAPEAAQSTLRKGLAMGAASAVHVADERLAGADLGRTAEVLAAALRRGGFDLVIAGDASTDGVGGVLVPWLAELLDVPAITRLESLEITADAVRGTRATDGGSMVAQAALPAIVSITEALPDPRFPALRGIMNAKKKPVEQLTLDDLEVEADETASPRSIMTAVAERPPRAAGEIITDEGDAGERIAAFLADRRLA
ncbi:electron transfer flavoprotein subunit beta/FixA family protein [Agrococcus sediminis]|uniref:Electron transfer flavoprotein subunit beta n=1 Tax=Agrococcus sediminis TaxID=2599924 RepID=A0A5M8QIX3_9MICO|nr:MULTISPECIES: electron transfer flavoprotein subunit beta/FixA family protein [Agrococcus]KAA6435218.1 electron transfer flavoprotein subunit beta/FixA family protein [Agrococcus sediminis]MDR7233535.1 electron transfer flavoprotein beta subunit [Agrococcus sp. BE272]